MTPARAARLSVSLAFVVIACGGPAAPTQVPSLTLSMQPEGTGVLAQATRVQLQARAAGFAGEVTYEWELGDGTRAAGSSVTHVFPSPGTFDVKVAARDARGGSASASRAIVANTLDGIWRSENYGWLFELRQEGSTIGGRVLGTDRNYYTAHFAVVGTIDQPNRVHFMAPALPPLGFTGEPASAIDRITGQIEFLVPRPDVLVRGLPAERVTETLSVRIVVRPDIGGVLYPDGLPSFRVGASGPVDVRAAFAAGTPCDFHLCVCRDPCQSCDLSSASGNGPIAAASGPLVAGDYRPLLRASRNGQLACSPLPADGLPLTYEVTAVHP